MRRSVFVFILSGVVMAAAGCQDEGTVRVHSINFTGVQAVDEGRLREALATRQSDRLPWGKKAFFDLAHGGVVERIDERGKVVESAAIGQDGRVCLAPLPMGYVALRLRLRRSPGDVRRPMQVHVKDASRVLGILRIEP